MKRRTRSKGPTIEWGPKGPPKRRHRWSRDWSKVRKVDSTRATPMKVGGTWPEGAPGNGRRSRKGGQSK